MRKLLTAAIIAAYACSATVWAAEAAPKKDAKQAQEAKKVQAPAKKKANDPKWKNNSLAKKQAECKANPQDPKCQKKAPAKDSKKK